MPNKKVYMTPDGVERNDLGSWTSRTTVKWNRMTATTGQLVSADTLLRKSCTRAWGLRASQLKRCTLRVDAQNDARIVEIYMKYDKNRKGYMSEKDFCNSVKELNGVEPPPDALRAIRLPKKLKKQDKP